jgi:hypothetical protein
MYLAVGEEGYENYSSVIFRICVVDRLFGLFEESGCGFAATAGCRARSDRCSAGSQGNARQADPRGRESASHCQRTGGRQACCDAGSRA